VFADLALDRQVGVPGSTYELYRAALAQRRALALGSGSLAWVDDLCDEHTIAFGNRDVLVVTALDGAPVRVPGVAEVLLASSAVDLDGDVATIPADTTAWLRLTATR
jgi:alpha-glucosidase